MESHVLDTGRRPESANSNARAGARSTAGGRERFIRNKELKDQGLQLKGGQSGFGKQITR